MAAAWRYAFTSVAGTSHIRGALPCQDASVCQLLATPAGTSVLVAIVADGAGSAAHSEEGAQLACTLLLEEITTLLDTGGAIEEVSKEFIGAWLTHFQHAIIGRAEAQGCGVREFACTLLAAIIGEEGGAFFQIGDGAIVVSTNDDPDEYGWIFWPQRGEYENVTVFITDPRAGDYLQHEVAARRFDEIALFTDGLQRLALHFATSSVHNPFFRPMFAPLRTASSGHLTAMSEALARFLDSPAINSRTDDDKTLVLATRRTGQPPTNAAAADHAREQAAEAAATVVGEDTPDDDPV